MRSLLAAFCALLLSCNALAAPQFPALTGRVVDKAHLLSAATRQSLESSLAAHEQRTTNQVVVVTIPRLEGSIEEYGVALGRHWGIGQKGKDNGVLLLISPSTHDVRIEVGYGLEGTLTDALSSAIIQQIIIPRFKAGDLQQGIVDGTGAILSVLEGKAVPIRIQQPQPPSFSPLEMWLSLAALLFFIIVMIRYPSFRCAVFYWLISGGRGGRGGGSSGGFSGGGGRFGGGGASGKW